MAAAPNAASSTAKLYKSVIEDVVSNVKEAFLDEGVDEAILHELKQVWETKVLATKSIDTFNPPPNPPTAARTSGGGHHHQQQQQQQQQHHHHNQSTSGSQTVVTHHQPSQQQQLQQQHHHQQQQHLHQQQQQIARPTHASHHDMQQSQHNYVNRQIQLMHSGVIAPSFVSNMTAAAAGGGVPHSVITNIHGGNIYMQLPGVPGGVRMLGASVPTVSAGTNNLVQSGRIIHKQDTNSTSSNNVSVVTVVPQMDGPSSSSSSSSGGIFKKNKVIVQFDGAGGISDDDDVIEEDEPANDEDEEQNEVVGPVEEGEPLNSEDDESDQSNDETFEADDVVVCQFEKVNRIRNKWKFVLKDGIINLGRKDYVFNKATGEAEF